MQEIFVSRKVQESIQELSEQILRVIPRGSNVGVIGIRNKGMIVAQRLVNLLSDAWQTKVYSGSVDITLYRDDITIRDVDGIPAVGITDIDFDINDKIIIVVDDVLHTGRSCRAAMEAVVEFGRPARIMLAVLIDRGGREFPIQADFVGARLEESSKDELLSVRFEETDGEDGIFISKK